MSFYNSAIAALFPLILTISTAQPNISTKSAIAQSTSPATTSQPSAIAKSWDARLVHTIPDNRNTRVVAFSNDGQLLATGGKRFETSADGKSITETIVQVLTLKSVIIPLWLIFI